MVRRRLYVPSSRDMLLVGTRTTDSALVWLLRSSTSTDSTGGDTSRPNTFSVNRSVV
nr:TPA_asm: m114.5 sORF 2 [Murid betaherpesvirus 1]DBA07890.1 TPA_asm: m114.5 sORF 2 [Murid betaherpesvirus 1]